MKPNDRRPKSTPDEIREARVLGFKVATSHFSQEKRERLLQEYLRLDARREANIKKFVATLGLRNVAEPDSPLQGDEERSSCRMQQLLKPDDLAAVINVSSRTIFNWYYGGIIPARIHVGKVIRFELEPVMAALEHASETPRANEFFRRRKRTKRTT